MSECHICGEEIAFVCKVSTRCGHDVHHQCLRRLVPKVECVVCKRRIVDVSSARINEDDEFCHVLCCKTTRRYYPPCPVEGCGMPLCKNHVLTNKQYQEILNRVEGKTLDERVEVYLEFGFKESEIGGTEISEEDWERIQRIVSSSNEEDLEKLKKIEKKSHVSISIPPLKTYEPRSLVAGEKYKPPNKSRQSQEHGASLKTLVPRSVKGRVHVSHQEDFALFSRGPL